MKKMVIAVSMIATSLAALPVIACTNIVITGSPESGIVASGRTFDFNVPIYPKIVLVPRNQSWTSIPQNQGQASGVSWTNKYGFVGLSVFGEDRLMADGINENGLSAAVLWLDETKYMARKGSNDLSAQDLVAYMLGNFTSTSEAKAAIQNLNVYGVYLASYQMIIPLHLIVTDAKGESFIAEWIDGKLNLYDKSDISALNGTLANSPPFKKQMANLAKYKHLRCASKGQRYSLTGLPGNSESKSRFIRAYKLRDCSEQNEGTGEYLIKTKDDSIERTTQIMGRVEKPEGEVVLGPDYAVGENLSYTRITIIRSHGTLDANSKSTSKLYFRTPENQSLRLIDLSQIDFNSLTATGKSFSSFVVDSEKYAKAQAAAIQSQ